MNRRRDWGGVSNAHPWRRIEFISDMSYCAPGGDTGLSRAHTRLSAVRLWYALTSDPGSFGWSNKARPSDSSGAVGTWNQRPILMGVL